MTNKPDAVQDHVRELAGSGVAAVLATCDRDRIPDLSRAWGIVLSDSGDTIDVCVYVGAGSRTLANLADHDQIALTMTRPSTYRSLQVKGRVVSMAQSTDADERRVRDHQRAFVDDVAAVGMPRETAVRFCEAEKQSCPDLLTISIRVESIFDQTPGPGAGARV